MADKTNTTASASNGSAAASDKRTKLGLVPVGKLASIADPRRGPTTRSAPSRSRSEEAHAKQMAEMLTPICSRSEIPRPSSSPSPATS